MRVSDRSISPASMQTDLTVPASFIHTPFRFECVQSDLSGPDARRMLPRVGVLRRAACAEA